MFPYKKEHLAPLDVAQFFRLLVRMCAAKLSLWQLGENHQMEAVALKSNSGQLKLKKRMADFENLELWL